MASLRPIPTPLSVRWREFRIQILPLILFVAALAGAIVLWRRHAVPVMVSAPVEHSHAGTSAPVTFVEK